MSNMPIRHFDEARRNVLQWLEELVLQPSIERALLSPDIFARIRVALWVSGEFTATQQNALAADLAQAAGPFWGGLWVNSIETSNADRAVFDELWEEGARHSDKIRVNERHRSLSVWLRHPLAPPWSADAEPPEGPPIVSFYAFKGGVGRSTALAIFAAQRAQAGERVVVIDLDLAAPGLGPLLTEPDAVQYGIVDYWLERPLLKEDVDLRDYYTRVSSPAIIGEGAIFVFPAGRFDETYLLKLARLDFTPSAGAEHPLTTLLRQIRADDELRPDWILLDARAGLSESAGFALGGLAHLNILFGNTSTASWSGLRQAIRRLGAERALRELPQEQCLLVQSMVPANPQIANLAQNDFRRNAQLTFEQEYYLPDPDDPEEDSQWYLRDMDSRDAPHVPVSLFYSEQIAFFVYLQDLIKYGLKADDYRELGARIINRFPRSAR
jgi:cellulose biosynthesis protein BcsQ